MLEVRESIDQVAERAGQRVGWWAELTGRGDGLYVIQSDAGVIADGLTQSQAMAIASEYNLTRTDAVTLARQLSKDDPKSA